MPAVLQRLMRHEDIQTTMTYYADLDAESTADAVWSAFANTFANSGQAQEKRRQANRHKVLSPKALQKPPGRVELPTYALRMCGDPVVSDAANALTTSDPAACTTACTGNPEIAQREADANPCDMDRLAAAIERLTADERSRLAALLGKAAGTQR
jgi:hypothetical protein